MVSAGGRAEHRAGISMVTGKQVFVNAKLNTCLGGAWFP